MGATSGSVHTSELPSITKFTSLLALLKGEAKACEQGLCLTASNYETSCDILQKRFGRPERIIFSHIQDFMKITVPRQPTISVLWKMYYDLQDHMRSFGSAERHRPTIRCGADTTRVVASATRPPFGVGLRG